MGSDPSPRPIVHGPDVEPGGFQAAKASIRQARRDLSTGGGRPPVGAAHGAFPFWGCRVRRVPPGSSQPSLALSWSLAAGTISAVAASRSFCNWLQTAPPRSRSFSAITSSRRSGPPEPLPGVLTAVLKPFSIGARVSVRSSASHH